MKVSAFEVAEAIVSEPSLRKAAQRLGLSRQAVSKRARGKRVQMLVQELRAEQLAKLRSEIRCAIGVGVQRLRRLIESDDERVALKAIEVALRLYTGDGDVQGDGVLVIED